MNLVFPWAMLEQMAAHLTACLPEEGCGLVGGLGETAQQMAPVENVLHSPVRFQMDAAGQLAAMLQFETADLDLLAIFHSHPRGPNHPSATDLAEFYYPGVIVVIAAPHSPDGTQPGTPQVGSWQFGGFQIEPNGYLAVKLDFLDRDSLVSRRRD